MHLSDIKWHYMVHYDIGRNQMAMKNLAVPMRTVDLAPMLTGAQMRAARALLKWSARVLSENSGVSYAAVQRAEQADEMPNMQARNLAAIKATFEANGIEFVDGSYSGGGGAGVRFKE